MVDKENWSTKKFSWWYAGLISIFIVLGAFLLLHFQVIETINLRIVYIVVILSGIVAFIKDLAKHIPERIGYLKSFKHSFRTGAYTCLLMLPVILIVLFIGLPKLGMVQRTGRFNEVPYQTGFMISMLAEMIATIMISSFVAALIPGFTKRSP